MNYTKSEMKIIHKVFQHYLDSHDSDEETRDLYLKIHPKLWKILPGNLIIHLQLSTWMRMEMNIKILH
jgi:hypothetical protein